MTGPEILHGVGLGKSAPTGRATGDITINEGQRKFVQFQEGCAVLHAPVGTGKTLALAERAAEASAEEWNPPAYCV